MDAFPSGLDVLPVCIMDFTPLPPGKYLSSDVSLVIGAQNYSLLHCVLHLVTVIHTQSNMWTVLKFMVFTFMFLFNLVLAYAICVPRFCHVELHLFVARQNIGWEEHLADAVFEPLVVATATH